MAAGRMKQRGVIPISLLLYAGAAIAVMGALAYAYHTVKESGRDEIRLEWKAANEKARREELAKGQAAAENKEKKDAAARVIYRTIEKKVDRVVDRVEYRNVCIESDGLQLARSAILGKSPDPAESDKPLRAPAGIDGRNSRGGFALDR